MDESKSALELAFVVSLDEAEEVSYVLEAHFVDAGKVATFGPFESVQISSNQITVSYKLTDVVVATLVSEPFAYKAVDGQWWINEATGPIAKIVVTVIH